MEVSDGSPMAGRRVRLGMHGPTVGRSSGDRREIVGRSQPRVDQPPPELGCMRMGRWWEMVGGGGEIAPARRPASA